MEACDGSSLSQPHAVTGSGRVARSASVPVFRSLFLRFLREHCEATCDPGDFIYKDELVKHFMRWGKRYGIGKLILYCYDIPVVMRELGFQDNYSWRDGSEYWFGIRWKPEVAP